MWIRLFVACSSDGYLAVLVCYMFFQVQNKLVQAWCAIACCGLGLLLMGCGQGPSDGDGLNGKLVLTGSSTCAPMVSEIAKKFEELHPSVRVDVQTGGSSRGIRDAQIGGADIGMASRKLKSSEANEMVVDTIAWDGVTFVIHKENPIVKLSKADLVAIYTGKKTNWKEFGGNNAKIVVSNRAEGRSELSLVTKYLGLDSDSIKASVVDGETQQSIKTVTTNKNAIVYTSVGAAQFAASRGEPLKLLPLDGVFAEAKLIQSGAFPLARPLILIRKKSENNPLAAEFIKFVLSGKMADVTESFGFIPPLNLDVELDDDLNESSEVNLPDTAATVN